MSRPKIHRVYSDTDLPKNWHEKVLILWKEDDARPAGREMSCDAFQRIFKRGTESLKEIASYDGGDWIARLYQGGMIKGVSCEGGFVGVLLE